MNPSRLKLRTTLVIVMIAAVVLSGVERVRGIARQPVWQSHRLGKTNVDARLSPHPAIEQLHAAAGTERAQRPTYKSQLLESQNVAQIARDWARV